MVDVAGTTIGKGFQGGWWALGRAQGWGLVGSRMRHWLATEVLWEQHRAGRAAGHWRQAVHEQEPRLVAAGCRVYRQQGAQVEVGAAGATEGGAAQQHWLPQAGEPACVGVAARASSRQSTAWRSWSRAQQRYVAVWVQWMRPTLQAGLVMLQRRALRRSPATAAISAYSICSHDGCAGQRSRARGRGKGGCASWVWPELLFVACLTQHCTCCCPT